MKKRLDLLEHISMGKSLMDLRMALLRMIPAKSNQHNSYAIALHHVDALRARLDTILFEECHSPDGFVLVGHELVELNKVYYFGDTKRVTRI
jgi:hypothetical protein